MGYGLNLTLIQDQGSLDQSLAVTCRTGISDLCIFGKQFVNLFDRTDGSF